MVGTLIFMSPEQVSRRPVDARSDVYSLGVTLYETLTLKPPFRGDTDHRIQEAILFEEPIAPRKLNARIRRDLETIILHALEKNPERRYSSAGALAKDLRRYLADEPIEASRAGPLKRAWRWTRRNRALAALLVVLVAGGVTAWGLVRMYRAEQQDRARVELEVKSERFLWTAQRSYADGQYQEALSHAAAAVMAQPSSIEARLLKARLLLELERIDDAARELNQLVAERPDLGAAHYLLAAVYRDRNPDRSETHRKAAEALLDKTADSFHLRAMAETKLEDAVKWLNEGVELDPSHYACLRSRAMAHYALHEYGEMEQDAERAVALRPRDAVGWSLRAIARRKRNRLEDALRDHARAIELSPESPELYSERRETLHLAGNHKRELEDAESCLRLDLSNVVYELNLLRALVCNGETSRAGENYRQLVDANPRRRHWFESWVNRQTFEMFSASPPEAGLSRPAQPATFLEMQEAMEYYHDLSRKAKRVVRSGYRASFSPDGRQMVYGRSDLSPVLSPPTSPESISGPHGPKPTISPSSSGLEILDLETRSVKRLVNSGKDPAWSPDGKHIVFVREPFFDAYREEELWIINLQEGKETRLAKGGFPSWSKNRERVYFHSRAVSMLQSMAIEDPGATPVSHQRSPGWYPAVSPDEKRLAYAVRNEVRIVDLSNGSLVQAWTAPELVAGLLVSWSPDGRELSVGGFNASNLRLWIFELESQKGLKVLEGSVTMGVWSPDGSRLAFDVRGPFWEIWMADLQPGIPTARSLAPAKTPEEHLQGLLEKYDRALVSQPGDVDAHHQRGHLHHSLGNWQKAFDDYSAALETQPDNAHLYYSRALVLGELEKPEEAVSDLSRAIAIRPQSSTLYKARARLQGVAGKEDAALADLEKLVELEPDNGESLNLLAWAYANGPVATRRPERAIDLALKAVEISPRGYNERNTLGIAYYRAGKFKKSAEALEEALALEGNGGTAFDFFFLAMSHFKLGEREKADEYYKKALEWVTRQKTSRSRRPTT